MTDSQLVRPGPMDNWRQVADAAPGFAEPITVAEKPGKGFAAEVRHLPRLAAAFAKAEAKAREFGLIDDKGTRDE